MEQRIKRLTDKVLTENNAFRCQDDYIGKMLDVSDEEKLRVIREEYSKIIKVDSDSLLMGEYYSIKFFEKTPPKSPKESGRDYSAYVHKVFMDGGNHISADFEKVLTRGFSGIICDIEEKRKSVSDAEQKAFLDELYYTSQSYISWALANADALSFAAENEKDENRRQELLEMSEICRKVPRFPAETFREAIQSYFFVFVLFHDGLGCLDRYLYPYYKADVEKGVLTRDEALSLIEELFIKIFALSGKGELRSGQHHGVIAGYTADGECAHNECTSLVLEALVELPLWRPQISYRVTSKTTIEQLSEALNANFARPDVIMFLNDDAIVPTLVGLGVEAQDAVRYSSSGCNETILTGCSQPGALEGHFNIVHSLEELLKNTDKLEKTADFDEFYKEWEEYLKKDLEVIFERSYDRDSSYEPMILADDGVMITGCIESATPVTRGGAKYNFCTWCLTGLVNLADSLSVIRQMCFDEKRFTLKELGTFLEANWQGYEIQRAYILNNARYFGNDDDYADLMINKAAKSVNDFAEKHTPYRGGRYLFGTLTGYEISHMVFGKSSGASPDGRYAGEPFAPSISPFPSSDKKGMISYLKSAAKIDPKLIQSSVVVNLKLDRAVSDSEEKRARLVAALKTYFSLGGIQLQINYLSADELINAQKEPEKYQNLRVRVTGFSGFFTSFDKALQDEIISRFTY